MAVSYIPDPFNKIRLYMCSYTDRRRRDREKKKIRKAENIRSKFPRFQAQLFLMSKVYYLVHSRCLVVTQPTTREWEAMKSYFLHDSIPFHVSYSQPLYFLFFWIWRLLLSDSQHIVCARKKILCTLFFIFIEICLRTSPLPRIALEFVCAHAKYSTKEIV